MSVTVHAGEFGEQVEYHLCQRHLAKPWVESECLLVIGEEREAVYEAPVQAE